MEFEPGTQRRPSLIKPLEGEIDEAGVMQLRVQYGWVSTHSEGGALLLDGITTLENQALVTNGQIWDPREPPGLDQLYASYYDRMHKCTRVEFLAEIAFWSAQYNVPAGETCGIDSANMPSGTTCVDFFDVNLPAQLDPSLCSGQQCPVGVPSP